MAKIPEPKDTPYSRKEAASYLISLGIMISPQTLANMAIDDNSGGGPPFYRYGWKCVFYKKSDLDAWVATKVKRIE